MDMVFDFLPYKKFFPTIWIKTSRRQIGGIVLRKKDFKTYAWTAIKDWETSRTVEIKYEASHTIPNSFSYRHERYPVSSMNTNLSDMWRSTLEIGVAQLFSVVEKTRRNHLFCVVWTEALSGIDFVRAQKLSDKVRTETE